MIKLIEAFSGIGAVSKAMNNINCYSNSRWCTSVLPFEAIV